jgi:hypothetical protein
LKVVLRGCARRLNHHRLSAIDLAPGISLEEEHYTTRIVYSPTYGDVVDDEYISRIS